MSDEHLHIVCLDAPSPPDYGGAIDMYCKIQALHAEGRKIILHFFSYKDHRGVQGLESFCEEIYVYKRTVFLKSLLTFKPYIVSSRIEPELIHRLNRDAYPVLLEGIHCSGIVPHLRAQKRIIIRVHNNESAYYRNLYNLERGLLKKIYFLYETYLLDQYQKSLSAQAAFAFISTVDQDAFQQQYCLLRHAFVPPFVPWQEITSLQGRGGYCLYHGNFSVSENRESVDWLATEIFSRLEVPLVVAGRNVDALTSLAGKERVSMVNNPSDAELSELIQQAHIHVLPSMNSTGVKLKLVHALFKGRFCMTNPEGVSGSGLENLVLQAQSVQEWQERIQLIMDKSFEEDDILQRRAITHLYNNSYNAKKLIGLL